MAKKESLDSLDVAEVKEPVAENKEIYEPLYAQIPKEIPEPSSSTEKLVKVKFNRAWSTGKYYDTTPEGKEVEITFMEAFTRYGNMASNRVKVYKAGEEAWLPERIAAHLENDIVTTYNPTPGILNKHQQLAGLGNLPEVATAQKV